jgi:hypothetical protein
MRILRFLALFPLYVAGSGLLFLIVGLLLYGGDALLLWVSTVAVPWSLPEAWAWWQALHPSAVLQWGFRLTRPLLAAYQVSRAAGHLFESVSRGTSVLFCLLSWGLIVGGLVAAYLDVARALVELAITRQAAHATSILWPFARLGLLIVLLNAGVPVVAQLAGIDAPSTLERQTLTVAPIVLAMLVSCLGCLGQKAIGKEPPEEMSR